MRWALLLVAVVAFGATAEAKFAATQGFSGKHAVDCGACHVAMPVVLDPDVTLAFEGLPDAWDADVSYDLVVRVRGGPAENPVPGQPVGGFDVEADAGTFEIPPPMEGLLRRPSDLELTYSGAGTLRRDWSLRWIAPNASVAPMTARFWLAGLAANGNHVMGGPDAVGERGDRYATARYEVPASAATWQAWKERPLAAPVLRPIGGVVNASRSLFLVHGSVGDEVDGAEWSLDARPWRVAIGAPAFFFDMAPVEPGPHELAVRAFRENQTSEPTLVRFLAEGPARAADAGASMGGPLPIVGMVVLVLLLLSPFLLKLLR